MNTLITTKNINFISIIIVLALTTISKSVSAQQSEKELIIADIAMKNEVHEMFVGRFMDVSDQYFLYKKLTDLCTEEELIELVNNHKNTVVRCYASWGLIDKEYKDLPKILNDFLEKDSVVTNVGSVAIPNESSIVFYYHYWQNIEVYNRSKDEILTQLDSVILYAENSPWRLQRKAFENRTYNGDYMKQIAFLAFEKEDYYALKYLFDWNRADYFKELEKSISSFCKNTNFKGNIDIYYEVIKMLFDLNTIQTKLVALEKLEKDDFWKNVYEESFLSLFERKNVIDIKEDIEILEEYIEEHQLKRF